MKSFPTLIVAAGLILSVLATVIFWTSSALPPEASQPANESRSAWTPALDRSGNKPPASVGSEILELMKSGNPQDQTRVFHEFLPDWVRHDPRAAAAFVTSPAAEPYRVDLMVVLTQTWTGLDPDEAEDFASGLANPTERNMALGYVAFQAAQSDARRAAQILENERLSPDRREILVENLAQQWASLDLQPLYEVLEKLPTGAERDGLVRRVALAQSQTDPARAAMTIYEEIDDPETQYDAAIPVLRSWARKDKNSALAWVENFPEGELRDRAVKVLSADVYGAYLDE